MPKYCLSCFVPDQFVATDRFLTIRVRIKVKKINLKHNLKSCSAHLQDIASHMNTISDLNKLCFDGSVKFIHKCK